MSKELAAFGWELAGEFVSCWDVLDRGENVISQLSVVVFEDRGGYVVEVRVDRVCCICGNLGRSGVGSRVAMEFLSVKASVRAQDGVASDGIGLFVCWGWVAPAVQRAWHVSFELSGLSGAKDDGFAVVVDDALGDESMKVRSTIDDGEWKVFKMVAEGFFGAVPERVGGWSARCEWIERFDVRGGVVDWREGMSVLVCVAGCYHVEGR